MEAGRLLSLLLHALLLLLGLLSLGLVDGRLVHKGNLVPWEKYFLLISYFLFY